MSKKDRSHRNPPRNSPKKADDSGAGHGRGRTEGNKILYLNESTGQTNYPRWREEVIKEAKSTLFFHTAKSLEENENVKYPRPKLSDYLEFQDEDRDKSLPRSRRPTSGSSQSRSPSRSTEQEAEPTVISRRRGGKKASTARMTRQLTDDEGGDEDDEEEEPTRGRSRGSPKGISELAEEDEIAREIYK